jgi:hypothetical protein
MYLNRAGINLKKTRNTLCVIDYKFICSQLHSYFCHICRVVNFFGRVENGCHISHTFYERYELFVHLSLFD